MRMRTLIIGTILTSAYLQPGPIHGGFYNTADALAETRWSPNYDPVFRDILFNLRTLADPASPSDPPMRKRYMLMDALGRKGTLDLQTLEQKLNYSAVLIRLGKADEATQFLLPVTREYPKNCFVMSHFATANFLASGDLRTRAPDYMKQALELWPKDWNELGEDERNFAQALGWEEVQFERFRRIEVCLQRLMRHRIREEARRKAKQPIEETVDPIFVDEKGTDRTPARFATEGGGYEAGRIAAAEKKKLPEDAVETVEQLLIWMPGDQRLFWLLGEVLNARAMDYSAKTQQKEKNLAIRDAYVIFHDLTSLFKSQTYAKDEIKSHHDVLAAYVKTMPDPHGLDPSKLPPLDDDPKDAPLSNQQWLRAMVVGFVTGFAVGLFALWQLQEMRRRRQARSTGNA